MSVGLLEGSMPTHSLTDALAETLALFEESGAPQTTSEVADRLELGRRSTYDRLERLVEAGYLETKKAGASARVWWRPGGSTGDLAKRPGDLAAETAAEASRSGGSAAVDRGDRAAFESLVDAVEEYAIFRLDAEGRVRTWNEGAERIKGYEAGEILGEHFSTSPSSSRIAVIVTFAQKRVPSARTRQPSSSVDPCSVASARFDSGTPASRSASV